MEEDAWFVELHVIWEFVGAAGVTPFVVAGIEFSKRIVSCNFSSAEIVVHKFVAFLDSSTPKYLLNYAEVQLILQTTLSIGQGHLMAWFRNSI